MIAQETKNIEEAKRHTSNESLSIGEKFFWCHAIASARGWEFIYTPEECVLSYNGSPIPQEEIDQDSTGQIYCSGEHIECPNYWKAMVRKDEEAKEYYSEFWQTNNLSEAIPDDELCEMQEERDPPLIEGTYPFFEATIEYAYGCITWLNDHMPDNLAKADK